MKTNKLNINLSAKMHIIKNKQKQKQNKTHIIKIEMKINLKQTICNNS